jgi:hypothetical protein
MLDEIYVIGRIIISQVKSMGKIPGLVWAFFGILVAVVSFITIWINKVPYPFLFYLTLVAGILAVAYGVFDIVNMRKKTEVEFQQKTQGSKFNQLDDIDLEGEKPIRQQQQHHAAQHAPQASSGPFGQTVSQGNVHHQNFAQQNTNQYSQHPIQQHPYAHQNAQQHGTRFCPNCGTQVLPHHRFCQACGNRLQ